MDYNAKEIILHKGNGKEFDSRRAHAVFEAPTRQAYDNNDITDEDMDGDDMANPHLSSSTSSSSTSASTSRPQPRRAPKRSRSKGRGTDMERLDEVYETVDELLEMYRTRSIPNAPTTPEMIMGILGGPVTVFPDEDSRAKASKLIASIYRSYPVIRDQQHIRDREDERRQKRLKRVETLEARLAEEKEKLAEM